MYAVKTTFLVALTVALFAALVFLYAHRLDRPMLYYYGASPELPQGRAVSFLNPFRDRHDEGLAKWLIGDLRAAGCEKIVRERLQAEPAQICPVFRSNSRATLIWIGLIQHDPRGDSRQLIYDLPKNRARLNVYFGMDEPGWGIRTVSILR
jgi:hypothetical protein